MTSLNRPLHFFLCSCCRWSIHLNQSNVSWFCAESHNESLIGSYPTCDPVTFLWIQTATPDMLWVGRLEYTIVWPSSVVKCPCPSHLTSDNLHIWTPNLIISSPSSWHFSSCNILRIFHVPNLNLLHSCSCLSPCDNIVVFFITVVPATDFSTLPWLFDRGSRHCLTERHLSRNVFLCACNVHSVVREGKMVGSQVFPSRSREALFQLH